MRSRIGFFTVSSCAVVVQQSLQHDRLICSPESWHYDNILLLGAVLCIKDMVRFLQSVRRQKA
eukprot:6475201-Amphidinium_carterae.2